MAVLNDAGTLTISVPDEGMAAALRESPLGSRLDVVVWGLDGAAPRSAFDLVVLPYMSPPSLLDRLRVVETAVVQSQMIGYDGVAELLPPGAVFCNAEGVHESSTAELALGLIIASQRSLPAFVRAQDAHTWRHRETRALAGSRVLVLGAGNVGRAVVARLRPFEVEVALVGRSARVEEGESILGMDRLGELLPDADVIVLALPLTKETSGLVDAGFLARMKRDALLVNVGRGALVVTPDLVDAASSGRVRAALDVVEPEPLPEDHPLWSLDGVLVTPHVGGHSAVMHDRVRLLLQRQVRALARGEMPTNVVLGRAW